MVLLKCQELLQHSVFNVRGITRAAQTVLGLTTTGRHTPDRRTIEQEPLPSILSMAVLIIEFIEQTN
jgi:hypothetical protein